MRRARAGGHAQGDRVAPRVLAIAGLHPPVNLMRLRQVCALIGPIATAVIEHQTGNGQRTSTARVTFRDDDAPPLGVRRPRQWSDGTSGEHEVLPLRGRR